MDENGEEREKRGEGGGVGKLYELKRRGRVECAQGQVEGMTSKPALIAQLGVELANWPRRRLGRVK